MPPPADVRGPWLQSYSGLKVHPFDAKPEEIRIEDIAHALSMICRYGGHASRFYSVSEHSIYVSQLCQPELALSGLLHDSPEAYIGDMTRPIKHLPEMAPYRQAETDLYRVIAQKFGVPAEIPPSVKQADEWLLHAEVRELMWPLHPDWFGRWLDPIAVVPQVEILCLDPREAKVAFMKRYYEVRDRL